MGATTYTPDQKTQAVTLADQVGPAEASRQLGIPRRTITDWAKAEGVVAQSVIQQAITTGDWDTVDADMRNLIAEAGVQWEDLQPAVSVRSMRAWFPKPVLPPGGTPALYMIGIEDGAYVKIGRTRHITRRLQQIQALSPHDVILLAWTFGAGPDEAALHHRLTHLRVRGEWFYHTAEIDAVIREWGM